MKAKEIREMLGLTVPQASDELNIPRQDLMDGEENEETGEVEPDEVYKRKRIGRIISIIPAVGAIVLFILTQDLTQPMIFFDNWSLAFAIIAIVNIVLAIVTRKKTDDDEDDEQQQAAAPATV